MRAFEFWHPRIFEAPYYIYLVLKCLQYGLPIKYLAKANFALDHGELGLGSKYSTQMAFDQGWFLPTLLLEPDSVAQQVVAEFVAKHGYPLILKPDIGALGKGIERIHDDAELHQSISNLPGTYLLQSYTPFECEYGVFFTRHNGESKITGINQKHFPTVHGNGRDNITVLAQAHERFTDHWRLFLKYIDTERVPAEGETVPLSFIGSHTMGCKFTDDSHLVTPALSAAVAELCASQPGFNFGRLDVKAQNLQAFQAGDFVVIEVNGIASLPTHMFDPDNSLRAAYRIFLAHGKQLVEIAHQHRDKPMQLLPYREIWHLAKANQALLNTMHERAKAN